MHRTPRPRGVSAAAWLLLFLAALAPSAAPQQGAESPAQEAPAPAPPPPSNGIDAARIQQEMEALRGSTELPESVRGTALGYWEQALTEVRAAEEHQAAATGFDNARLEAPARLEALRAQLAAPEGGPELPPPGAPLNALQEALDLANAEAVQEQQALAALESDRAHRAARRAELPGLIAASRQALQQLGDAPVPPTDTPAAVAAAQRGLHEARRKRASAQLAMQEAELASYEARGELLTARVDAATRATQRARTRVEQLTGRVTDRRREEAEQAARQAEERTRRLGEHEVARELAASNARLATRRVEVTDLLTRMGQLHLDLDRLAYLLGEKRSRVEDKVRVAGFTDSIALLLRRHAGELPDARAHRAALLERRDTLNTLELELLDVEEERGRLVTEFEAEVEARMAQVAADLDPTLRAEIESGVRDLLNQRLAYLTEIKEDLDRTFAQVVDVNTEEQQLILAVEDYAQFIDEHVLWVASTDPLALEDIPQAGRAVAWLLDGPAWLAVGRDALQRLADEPFTALGVAGALLALLLVRPLVRRRVIRLGKAPRTGRAPSIRPALVVLAYGLLNASLGPLLLLLLGWWLLRTGQADGRGLALGQALQSLAMLLFSVSLLRRAVLPWGLGDVHLRWPKDALQSVRRHIPVLSVIAVPAFFISALLRARGEPEALDSLGRAALIVALLALAAFLQRLLRPSGPVLAASASSRTVGLAYGSRRFWYPLAVGVPVVLALAAGFGFHYTAMEFGERLFQTWLLVLLIVLGRSTALRFLVMEQRKLRLEQARRRRESQKTETPEGEMSASVSELMLDDTADEVDLAQVDMQTRRILGTVVAVALIAGLGWVWANVLPALGALERVELWSVSRDVVPEGGGVALPTEVPVSLGDLLVALITFGVVVVAVRNIPGLLELSVLRRLPLAPGMSYAITTLVRYILVVSGVIIASNFLGLSWDRVQWLVAAVSVGLGFGLQEIFANFVSGLIILFERPIRMGDVVTVGGVEGVVTRIRIRATTIRDWDRRELLVPNREFITGQLINWTLTDPITRVVFPVGVAYGSDTALVAKLLMEVAHKHPLVLGDPEPHVLFRSFGDSSLNFELRVFIATRDHWVRLTHELNSGIDATFAAHGVTIPFPQRDVHVRTYGPGGSSGTATVLTPGGAAD